jgi:DtxR family Mn-dependent transcriptional regulator
MSIATENFLKTVYRLTVTPGIKAKPGLIAKELDISNAAATDMARNLADKELLHYEKYHEIRLTEKGKNEALRLIRKHRLWETFLFQLFNINLGEIHREAELLEHQTSDFLAGKISEYLGNPQFDPHGDPIPTESGEVQIENSFLPLTLVQEDRDYTIKRLYSASNDFFEFCENNGINIEENLRVEKQYPEQGMTTIKIRNTKIILNKDFANKIFVE